MVQITFIQPDGELIAVGVQPGQSLMQVAVANSVKGIRAECGGSAMCGTCHVHFDPAYADRVLPPDLDECEMLNALAQERHPNSRLSCQIMVESALDGATVTVPAEQ